MSAAPRAPVICSNTQAEGWRRGEAPRKCQTVEFFIRLQTTKNKETMPKAK